MNLLVVPSWYPSRAMPAAGLFVRDQVAAVAAARPQWRLAVAGWGHHDGALSLRSPRTSARALAWRADARPQWREVEQGAARWFEVSVPRLSWTLAWRQGGACGLLDAVRRGLDDTERRLGPVALLHAHVGLPAGWIAARLRAERGLPYLLTEHSSPFPVAPLRRRDRGRDGNAVVPALREAFEQAAAVIAVGPSLEQQIVRCGLPCHRVIGNAVDAARFATVARAGTKRPPFVFLTLGALTRQKGVDLLLDALARWNPPPGRVELRIGGDGPERGTLQRRAFALGLANRVRFLGSLAPAEVPAAFGAADAFVLASRHESFGVVVVEALMSGLPVVATRSGGPETIVGEGDGLLVPTDDVPALASALAQVADRTFDGAALRARAVAHHGQAAIGARLAAVYESVLAR